MKRSNNKQKEMTAALYVRLSRDDNLEGDSYSIGNQKKLLTKIAKEKGYTNLLIFCDDGISGVTMERPGYKAMIEAIENNKISAVFVKDLSRLGRNYIEVGRLTEEFFPEYDIRLVKQPFSGEERHRMSQKPSKRQRFKNFILRRKLNVLGLLVITVMSALITLVCAIRGFVYTDILFIVSLLLVALCFVQSIKLKKSFRTIPQHFKSSRRRHLHAENNMERPEA